MCFCYLSCGQERSRRKEKDVAAPGPALPAGGNTSGHRGRVTPLHPRVIPAINPRDQRELLSIDMFTREVRL